MITPEQAIATVTPEWIDRAWREFLYEGKLEAMSRIGEQIRFIVPSPPQSMFVDIAMSVDTTVNFETINLKVERIPSRSYRIGCVYRLTSDDENIQQALDKYEVYATRTKDDLDRPSLKGAIEDTERMRNELRERDEEINRLRALTVGISSREPRRRSINRRKQERA